MIPLEEIKDLYTNQLKHKLLGLERTRKNVLTLYIFAIVLIFVPVAVYFLFKNSPDVHFSRFFPILILGALSGVVFIFMAIKKHRVYRAIFKKEVVSRIVHAIDPEWSYQADACLSQIEYSSSDLFRTAFDRYNGDDLISGVIESTDFRCSELHTEYKTTTTDSKGKSRTEWHTIFKGLFFHADFNKEFFGKTYVVPDQMEKLFGKFGQNIQRYTGNADLVKLENPEFEKYFVVHATDQIEARYILTPTMMEAMVKLRKEYNRSIHISFSGSRVYCAFSFGEDLFEPRVFKSGVNFKDIETIYNLFMINATIIKELNLNTRIWTKK
ncbi:MAG: DUF3137 domain-containing protein [Bacteroidota bacterium]